VRGHVVPPFDETPRSESSGADTDLPLGVLSLLCGLPDERGGRGSGQSGKVRTLALRWLIAAVLIGLVVFVFLAAGNPAIARIRGEVVSVDQVDERIEVCVVNPVDAGSTYGDREFDSTECWSGDVSDGLPNLGDCVVLQTQGESSVLKVTPARACDAP